MLHNPLPTAAAPFVGRAEELASIASLLATDNCRLLTLVGPGGIGKTRLALESTRAQSSLFSDGVLFCALQALNSAELMVTALADAIDFQFSPGDPPRQQLLDYLSKKSCLLVLDNFEHLLDAAVLITDMLQSAPNLKILITSRERLNLLEEWVLEVSGLPYPRHEAESEIEHYDAVRLFVQNARRVQVGFTLTSAQKPAIARICRLVGGMPLGIELAAAWVHVLPCEALAGEIERSLEILETHARNMLPRHRNMRAVFAPTWERLSDLERDVFMKLSVFRGGFTRQAAEQAAGASLQMLSSLADKSLLRIDAQQRYDLHELLRQYGEEQLTLLQDATERARNAHCAYYTAYLARSWRRLTGSEIALVLHEINVELENIRTAWEWAVSQRKVGEIEAALDSLWFFYDQGSRYHEGEQLFARAASQLKDAAPEYTQLWAKVIARHGALCRTVLLGEKSKSLLEASVSVLRHNGADSDLAFALSRLSAVVADRNTSLRCLEESLVLYTELDDQWGMAEVLNWLCIFHLGQSFQQNSRASLERSQQYAQEELTLSQQLGSFYSIARAWVNLGQVAYFLEEYDQAREYFQKSLEIFEGIGTHWGIPFTLWSLGNCACALGSYADARRFALQGLQLAFDPRVTTDVQFTYPFLVVVARIWLLEGMIEAAYELFAVVDQWRQQMGFTKNTISFHPLSLLDQDLPPHLIAAVARGRTRDLATVVQEIVHELSQPESRPPSTSSQSANRTLVEPLSVRELDVLRLIAQGLTNPEIVAQLGVAESTVKKHINHLYGKLGVQNRTQALIRAQEWKLV